MKFEIIQDPKFVGCLNCSSVPVKTLSKDFKFSFDCADNITIYIGDKEFVDYPDSDKEYILEDFEKEYKEAIDRCDAITLCFVSAFHDEKYELNKEDGQWYLVEQGIGYA